VRERFLAPLHAHLQVAGLGHISEISDADAPHQPRGCPFQAWSLAELLRIERIVLAPVAKPAARKKRINRELLTLASV
jgi:glycogen debranching enzyme